MNPSTISDDLLNSAQAGDIDAENELFANLRARFIGLAKYILYKSYPAMAESILDSDAEDIVQNALIAIQAKYKDVDFQGGFVSWGIKFLRNNIGNYMMSKQRSDEKISKLDSREYYLYYKTDPEDEKYEYKELVEKIKLCLKKLSGDCQKIIMIFLRDGSREDVIDQFANVPIGTIDNKIYRCRKKFKALLIMDGYIS